MKNPSKKSKAELALIALFDEMEKESFVKKHFRMDRKRSEAVGGEIRSSEVPVGNRARGVSITSVISYECRVVRNRSYSAGFLVPEDFLGMVNWVPGAIPSISHTMRGAATNEGREANTLSVMTILLCRLSSHAMIDFVMIPTSQSAYTVLKMIERAAKSVASSMDTTTMLGDSSRRDTLSRPTTDYLIQELNELIQITSQLAKSISVVYERKAERRVVIPLYMMQIAQSDHPVPGALPVCGGVFETKRDRPMIDKLEVDRIGTVPIVFRQSSYSTVDKWLADISRQPVAGGVVDSMCGVADITTTMPKSILVGSSTKSLQLDTLGCGGESESIIGNDMLGKSVAMHIEPVPGKMLTKAYFASQWTINLMNTVDIIHCLDIAADAGILTRETVVPMILASVISEMTGHEKKESSMDVDIMLAMIGLLKSLSITVAAPFLEDPSTFAGKIQDMVQPLFIGITTTSAVGGGNGKARSNREEHPRSGRGAEVKDSTKTGGEGRPRSSRKA